jgi:phage baseplate assembly protein W
VADRYGVSLQVEDGDLVLQDGSLVQVQGLPNLMQALTLRILTPYGTDIFNPTYGFDLSNLFGSSLNTRARRDLISLNLVRTLSTDRRVREVRDIQFRTPPDGYRRGWPVDVTLITIENQASPLALSIGG